MIKKAKSILTSKGPSIQGDHTVLQKKTDILKHQGPIISHFLFLKSLIANIFRQLQMSFSSFTYSLVAAVEHSSKY